MGKIILVTGGSRSGKSSYAQKRAEELSRRKLFIATCPKVDNEIDNRISQHQQERDGKGWITIEEEVKLREVIESQENIDVILVDCITLWINNLLYGALHANKTVSENDIEHHVNQIMESCSKIKATVIIVSNEVGSGIIPESPETRLYRDLVGRCNQCIGARADEVVFVTCGIPNRIK